MAKIKNADGLSGSQVIILNILAKSADGMTANDINFAAGGVPVNVQTIGPTDPDLVPKHRESLRGREMVRPEQYEGDEVRWYITDEGRKQVQKGMKGRKIGAEKKVPNDILDPAVVAFKKLRAYGLEQYTGDDIEEFRAKLPKAYHDVDPTDLWNQILARRKQGAFKDPEEQKRKAMQRILREFGNKGTMIEGFLNEEQVSELLARLGGDMGE